MNTHLPIKDKLAVVFGGIVGGDVDRNGYGNLVDYKSCAKTIIHNIINPNDCDVFIHSWSVDQEKDLVSIYKPKKYLFEQQEMFGFRLDSNEAIHPTIGQAFRTTSRYVSIERGMNLKRQYEQEQGFKYKWILILRFDYLVLKKLSLEGLDPESIYICYEPHWPDIDEERKVYDGIFLGSSEVMDTFYNFGTDILKNFYPGRVDDCHHLIYDRLLERVGSSQRIKYVYERFRDIEIWRFVNNPNLNPLGIRYGVSDTKIKAELLLKKIDKEEFREFTKQDKEIGYSDRKELVFLSTLAFFVNAKYIVEIGVHKGDMALHLCNIAQVNGGKYIGFDVWDTHGLKKQYESNISKELVAQKLIDNHLDRFELVQINTNDSKELFEQKLDELCPEGIDFAFIDACHSYYGIFNNFFSIYPRLSATGIIVFHDTVIIDGCREFILDLRTKFYDGTFDLIDLPYGNGRQHCGVSILSKRSFPLLPLGITEICGSISSPREIESREARWFEAETYKSILIPKVDKKSILLDKLGIYKKRKKFE